jgi:hypothetical protein
MAVEAVPAGRSWGARGRARLALLLVTLIGPAAGGESLKAVYDAAGAGGGYDKYIVLQQGVTYTGGLWVGGTFNRVTGAFEGDGVDVRIVGSGAILDLKGDEICFAYCNRRLDIDDCVIVNGGVRFRGYDDTITTRVPQGLVRYVTFYRPVDYGVRLFGCGAGILVERNIFVDAVDTGPDFMFLTGELSGWLPTGGNVSLSLQASVFEVFDNWSYHKDPGANGDAVRHFNLLCDYG